MRANRAALLIRCTEEVAQSIREAAKNESRTSSAYVNGRGHEQDMPDARLPHTRNYLIIRPTSKFEFCVLPLLALAFHNLLKLSNKVSSASSVRCVLIGVALPKHWFLTQRFEHLACPE